MNLGSKNIYKNILIGSILVITLVIVSLMYKLSNTPKDLKTLTSIGVSVTNINLDNSYSIPVITSTVYIDSLKKKISDIENIEATLDSLNFSEQSSDTISKLKEGLESNKLLYTQLIEILSSPASIDLNTSFSNALTIKNSCEATYKWCREKNIPIYLSKENNLYLDNIFSYINQLIKLNRDVDIKTSQKNQFIITIDRLSRDFSPLMEDLFNTLNIIKKDKRNINVLVPDIHTKIQTFEKLKSELYLISIPENGSELFSSLEESFTNYESYINTLLKGVLEEINTNKPDNAFYDIAKNKYEDTSSSINSFQNLFIEYKNN